jgi:cytosine/creatinine deaminase
MSRQFLLNNHITQEDFRFYSEAFLEAEKGLKAGGIPIGSVLVYEGKILGRGYNQRIQKSSAILHAEMSAIENAGRVPARIYQHCTLYTTLSPCSMCSGTSLLYKIPRIVIGENQNFVGEEALLKEKGVTLIVLQDKRTIDMMEKFIKNNPTLWYEDIGEEH